MATAVNTSTLEVVIERFPTVLAKPAYQSGGALDGQWLVLGLAARAALADLIARNVPKRYWVVTASAPYVRQATAPEMAAADVAPANIAAARASVMRALAVKFGAHTDAVEAYLKANGGTRQQAIAALIQAALAKGDATATAASAWKAAADACTDVPSSLAKLSDPAVAVSVGVMVTR